MRPKISRLTAHRETDKHKANCAVSNQQGINIAGRLVMAGQDSPNVSRVKEAEIRFSLVVACHCSILAIDQVGDVVSKLGIGSPLGDIRLHRTKCASVMKHVMGTFLKEQLVNDISGRRYSLIVDEPTDVGAQKRLCVLVTFFNKILMQITTSYLGLVPVQSTTDLENAKTIQERCKEVLEDALQQVETRLSANKDIFRLSNLSSKTVLNKTSRPTLAGMSSTHLIPPENWGKVDYQYRRLLFTDWQKKECFVGKQLAELEAEEFWIGVRGHKDFLELAELGRYFLTLKSCYHGIDVSMFFLAQTKPKVLKNQDLLKERNKNAW